MADENDKIDRKIEKALEKLDQIVDEEKIDKFLDAYEAKFNAFEKKMMEPEKPRFFSTNKRIVLFIALLYVSTFYLMSEHETTAQKLSSLTVSGMTVLVFIFIGWVAIKIIGEPKPPEKP